MVIEIDQLVFLSNLALVIVTALACYVTVREGHRHEEKVAASDKDTEKDLVKIIHEVLEQEHATQDKLDDATTIRV